MDQVSRDNTTSADKEIVENGLRNVNVSIIKLLSKAIEEDPCADIGPLIERTSRRYATMRTAVLERPRKRKAKEELRSHVHNSLPPVKIQRIEKVDDNLLNPCGSSKILNELDPRICRMLGNAEVIHSPFPDSILQNLRKALSRSMVIWKACSKIVLQVTNDIVVKIGAHVDEGEPMMLNYVAQHAPAIPIPKPLGMFIVGDITFAFMTRITGSTLEERWPNMTSDQKFSVRAQLDEILSDLRRVPYVVGTPLGSVSGSRLCTDTRATRRVSKSPIYSLKDFHDFVMSSPKPRVSQSYLKWLRSLLKDDYLIVLTHADFHPRNILVDNDVEGNAFVSGIIDWEMGGWYPEYWETLKAFNTRGSDDNSDWWQLLPDTIGKYSEVVAIHSLVERTSEYI